MNIGFICNISNSHGTGHFYRCLALSQILNKKNFFLAKSFQTVLNLKRITNFLR